jgi:hypothetical protein
LALASLAGGDRSVGLDPHGLLRQGLLLLLLHNTKPQNVCFTGKDKAILGHAMKAYWWKKGVAPHILNLDTTWQ